MTMMMIMVWETVVEIEPVMVTIKGKIILTVVVMKGET